MTCELDAIANIYAMKVEICIYSEHSPALQVTAPQKLLSLCWIVLWLWNRATKAYLASHIPVSIQGPFCLITPGPLLIPFLSHTGLLCAKLPPNDCCLRLYCTISILALPFPGNLGYNSARLFPQTLLPPPTVPAPKQLSNHTNFRFELRLQSIKEA